MHKFFIKSSQITDNQIEIADENLNHIKNVLRLAPKEQVFITDDDEREYLAEIHQYTEHSVCLNIIEQLEVKRESNLEISLFQGLPKADKMELIIQKLTELGAHAIVPTQMKRCVVKIENGSKESKKIERWQKIAQEAAKQSKRNRILKVENIVSLRQFADWEKYDLILVPYENENQQGLKRVLEQYEAGTALKIAVVIGPEGGFEESEIQFLIEKGAKIVSLGKRILRTETASIAITAMLQYALGDMSEI